MEVNPPAGAPQFPLEDFNANKQVDTLLSPAFLASRHGRVIESRWNLNRDGGQAGKSDSVEVSVLKIADGDARLPSPKIPQAPDDKVLDLNTFAGNAEITVLPWTGISTDNSVQLKVVGKDDKDDDHIIPILNDHKITEVEMTSGIKETLTREKLSPLKHATELKVIVEVFPSPSNTTIIEFPSLNLNLLKTFLIITESFETSRTGEYHAGTMLDFPNLIFNLITGSIHILEASNWNAPQITGKFFFVSNHATIRFTLKRPAKSFKFGIYNEFKTTATYKCYDENLDLILSRSTPSYGSSYKVWVDVEETKNRKIKYIDIIDRGASYIDNFSLVIE